MCNKIQLIDSIVEIKKIKDINFNFENLRKEVFSFHNCIQIRNLFLKDKFKQKKRIYDAIKSLMEARSHFDTCMTILKSLFELESNEYIQHANTKYKTYQGFTSYLGISNARLDMLTESLKEIERSTDIIINQISLTWIENYKNTLDHYMNSFIINSLKESIRKFKIIPEEKIIDVKGENKTVKIVKDMEFFSYLLILECYRTSEIEGAIARQIITQGGKASSLKTMEFTPVAQPTGLPPDMRTVEEESNVEEELYSDVQ
jgi:hypothetical protein